MYSKERGLGWHNVPVAYITSLCMEVMKARRKTDAPIYTFTKHRCLARRGSPSRTTAVANVRCCCCWSHFANIYTMFHALEVCSCDALALEESCREKSFNPEFILWFIVIGYDYYCTHWLVYQPHTPTRVKDFGGTWMLITLTAYHFGFFLFYHQDFWWVWGF